MGRQKQKLNAEDAENMVEDAEGST